MRSGLQGGCRVLAALLVAGAARAGDVSVQQWTDPGTGGWSNAAPGAVLSNPGGYLEFTFLQQAVPALVEDQAAVEVPSGVVLTNVTFRFRADPVPPSSLRLVFECPTNGRVWQLNLPAPAPAGAWNAYNVPLSYRAGWFRGPDGGEADFVADVRGISRIALRVCRHGSTGAQRYGLDDFALQGLSLGPADRDGDGMPDVWETENELDPDHAGDGSGDADEDGMTNYAEYRAGTDPRDGASVFDVRIERVAVPPGAPVEGVVLLWNSISNRTYAVWRTLDLAGAGLSPVETAVPATPPLNTYVAPVPTNARAGFFRVDVEDP